MSTAQDFEIREALARLKEEGHEANLADSLSCHPFPARMPLGLAAYLLAGLVPVQSHVLDPMAGSGSTLVAARKLGHFGHGVDIDPLAVLISRSATRSYQRHRLERLGDRVLTKAQEIRANLLPRASISTMLRTSTEEKGFLKYWFPRGSQRELFCLMQAIREERDVALRNVAWTAFSTLIIAKETSVSYAIDIPRSRPHKDEDRDIDLPFDVWPRRFSTLMSRLPFLDKMTDGAEPQIELGDARHLSHANDSVDLVLTSPPYLNAVDYLRGHKFALLWMGHGLVSLRKTRSTMIGCERGMYQPDGLSPVIEEELALAIEQERLQALTRRYLSDLRYSILEMKRVVRPGGIIAVVLGPSILDRKKPDSIEVARLLAESSDLEFIGGVLRPLKKTRRSLPPPEVVPEKSELAVRMACEAIVVLRKRNHK